LGLTRAGGKSACQEYACDEFSVTHGDRPQPHFCNPYAKAACLAQGQLSRFVAGVVDFVTRVGEFTLYGWSHATKIPALICLCQQDICTFTSKRCTLVLNSGTSWL
jgi:hypothetical protein